MRYEELFSFEPIESVIQLREADAAERALALVETFVISDHLAGQLRDVVLPNLQFDEPADTKGLLVVGNYGTGKSHLMSMLSALAEYPEAVDVLQNPEVAEAAGVISGKYKVIRTEIGSTANNLRDMLCEVLTQGLRQMGIEYTFPPLDTVVNNKDAIEEMMAAVNARFPDHGLLLVVDELLEYLRSKSDQELVLDLSFLRELGEMCALVRFRLIAGLQESLFDNPSFQHVKDTVIRVRDRFQQLRITREDVEFVVAERLLRKTPQQQERIRGHLSKFTALYDNLAERIDRYVRLFPVHPAYLQLFEQLTFAEKREVLRTLSHEMKKLIGTEVPADETGLLSYDSYLSYVRENAALRSAVEVKEVLDNSEVLETRIQEAFTRPQYRPMAIRICRGLAIQRMATDDIYAPIGPTAPELRDGLSLHQDDLAEQTSDFLGGIVEICLKEIITTMNGQYITHNEENGQFYLDLKKDIDYDVLIEERAQSLSGNQLDRYYFQAVARLMECTDHTYVTGYKIWEHELEWVDHGINRRGYLFFGAPNERSTAQPPRDFYVYFLQPHEAPSYKDGRLADEVFFVLKRRDDDFNTVLRLYGAAQELALHASAGAKEIYKGKADGYLQKLTGWLRENMLAAYDVIHRGVPRKMVQRLHGQRGDGMTVRDLVNQVASGCLAPAFEERYPGYPRFSGQLTTANLSRAVEAAIGVLAGRALTQDARVVLDGLQLLEDGRIRPRLSPYAKSVLSRIEAIGAGQVLNRSDLMFEEDSLHWEREHRLEPELFIVVLLSLVHSGDIVLSLRGKKLDAANLDAAAGTSLDDLCTFRHIERPRDLPLSALVALLELLGLPDGLMRNPDTREEGIRRIHEKSREKVDMLVVIAQHLQGGFPWWGSPLVDETQQARYRAQLDAFKAFLERVQQFNSPGKLRNFLFSADDINAQRANLELLEELGRLKRALDELGLMAGYLATAEQVLTPEDPWIEQMGAVRERLRAQMLDAQIRAGEDFRQQITLELGRIKQEYMERYAQLHRRNRLDRGEDEKAQRLRGGPDIQRLQALTAISLLPHSNLTELQRQLADLKPCYSFSTEDIKDQPVCPHCNFRPRADAEEVNVALMLDELEDKLERLVESWEAILLENLDDPTAQQSFELLVPEQRAAVTGFIGARRLPDEVSTELVQGIQEALSGLESVTITADDLLEALGAAAGPCTVEQFRSRLEELIESCTRGRDAARVRLRVVGEETEER